MKQSIRILELAGIPDIILESFKDKKKKWMKNDPKIKQKDIDLAFDVFKSLKKRGILKGSIGDISQYSSLVDLNTVLNTYKYKKTKREKVKDAIVHFENEDYRIIEPKSFEASCKHGSGTNWCISLPSSTQYWYDYTEADMRFIFIQDFKNNDKFAIVVYPHQKGQTGVVELFDKHDNSVNTSKIKKYKVPNKLLKNPIKPKTITWLIDHVNNSDGAEIKINGKKITVIGYLDFMGMLSLGSLKFDEYVYYLDPTHYYRLDELTGTVINDTPFLDSERILFLLIQALFLY